MQTYQQAEKKLAGRTRRKLEHNTYLERRSDSTIAVKYHATDIVVFHPTYTEFFTGGWRTVTTKARLKRYGLPGLWQQNGEWYIDNFHHTFQEGLKKVNETFEYQGYGEDQKKQRNALKKRIKAYATGFVEQIYAGKIPAPSQGDCWGCLFHKQDIAPCGPLGADHLLSHIEEKYYVPSLLVNALESLGGSQAMKMVVADSFGGKPPEGWPGTIVKDQLIKFITRYVQRGLGMAA